MLLIIVWILMLGFLGPILISSVTFEGPILGFILILGLGYITFKILKKLFN